MKDGYMQSKIEELKIMLNGMDDYSLLSKDLLFHHLIDEILPSSEAIKKHLLKEKFIEIDNYRLSVWLNKINIQIDDIVKNNNKIVLYGNGTVTQLLKHMFRDKVVMIVDKDKSENSEPAEALKYCDFECIVIMVLGREEVIVNSLINTYGIDKKKIIQFNI